MGRLSGNPTIPLHSVSERGYWAEGSLVIPAQVSIYLLDIRLDHFVGWIAIHLPLQLIAHHNQSILIITIFGTHILLIQPLDLFLNLANAIAIGQLLLESSFQGFIVFSAIIITDLSPVILDGAQQLIRDAITIAIDPQINGLHRWFDAAKGIETRGFALQSNVTNIVVSRVIGLSQRLARNKEKRCKRKKQDRSLRHSKVFIYGC
jgi:hypothetical protein